ncbi:ABC transporter substrate-binding protein [Ornithinimicrobium cavernae]|uniref:ABC transporter substrate-binding protein n=1 Tax=Ornithinimicrobium cavernae TaxID=2666047 RepID=UPI000D69A556|nr:ABC transporter substrate-binding protein [Ornithinimicrobium cavernae]
MTSVRTFFVLAAASVLPLAACAEVAGEADGDTSDASTASGAQADSLTVGTTDVVTALDPAGSWDLGSAVLHGQIYRWLLTSEPGSTDPVPDVAETAEFTAPDEYTVTIRPDQKFANGNDLTASDVKFSFERLVGINDPNGPAQLLGDLKSIETPDDHTVVFLLNSDNNVLWPQILTSPAGYILDEESFPADNLATDAEIVEANAFGGQYAMTNYSANQHAVMTRNDLYDGLLGSAQTKDVTFQYYTDASNLKLDIEQGQVDVAYRTLGATAVADLANKDGVKVHLGPGAELRYFVFNAETAPYGSATDEPDPDKALAVRQAVADLVDREALAEDVYQGTYQPVYSVVPSALDGAVDSYLDAYGDGSGGPDAERAADRLSEAGVETPVTLNLQYNNDHYGESAADEYAMIKSQLEADGLFTVNVQSTVWSEYSNGYRNDEYPLYQLGWFTDYPDADNYLNLVYGSDAVESILGKANEDPTTNELIEQSRLETDAAARADLLGQAQDALADYLPIVPLLQGQDVIVARSNVQGVEETQDPSFRFRVGLLSKTD